MGRKKKEKYFLISEEDDVFAFPINWEYLPSEVREGCNSEQLYESISYTKGVGFKESLIMYFIELDQSGFEEAIKDESRKVVEDIKTGIKFII